MIPKGQHYGDGKGDVLPPPHNPCCSEVIWAATCDFQQCGILTSVGSDEPVPLSFKLRDSKWCSVSGWKLIEYSSGKQRLWPDCAYAQADLSLCWSHIPHCLKSHVMAQLCSKSLLKYGSLTQYHSVGFSVQRRNFLIWWQWLEFSEYFTYLLVGNSRNGKRLLRRPGV